ncbi:hypothetical protein MBAV_000916, partial [Candidatus Magnetobacterium bavaricum]
MVDIFKEGYAEDWLAFDASDPNAFAVGVADDSMGTEFKIGDIVIISPSVVPITGDFVLAKHGNNVIIRKLKILDLAILLKPLNPNYDDIN